MRKNVLSIIFACCVSISLAQTPPIVKALAGTITEPNAKDQEGWKANEWNGLFFYEGKGTPTKLCVTDGTSAGTQYLAEVGPGAVVATIPAQDFMYIITNRYVSFSPLLLEAQIWKSDGTTAGTSQVFVMPQSSISNSNIWTSDAFAKKNFSVIGNTMFFGGYDAVNGSELWMTDGTAAGTHIVKDIKPGTGNSSPMAFCKIGNDVFFSSYQTGLERKLWKTNGTEAGTVQVAVPEPFFLLENVVALVNNKMIFFAHNTVDGYEPYVSDGTAAGTFMLKNINPAGNSLLPQVQNAHMRFNSKHCFFVATNGTANALWRTDGTAAGTIQLTTNAQAVWSGVSGGSYTDVDESGLWMLEYSGGGSSEKLYRSDGSVEGTYLVATALSYAQNIKIYKNALWMASRTTGAIFNVEPWRSGGNMATTNNVFDIAASSASSSPYGYFVKNGKLFFFASTSSPSGHNLYQHTGDFTFNGSVTGGNWRDSANWNSMMPPGITDSVFINAGTPNPLNVQSGNAYAGTLITGSNASIGLTNSTDSLIINERLFTGATNIFSGNGVLTLRSVSNDTVSLAGGFTASNLALQSTSSLDAGNISISNNVALSNNAQLLLNNNSMTLTGSTSTITRTGNSYVNTNGTGRLIIENIGAAGRAAAVTFPIGTSNNYNPVVITNQGTTDHFAARVQPQIFPTYAGETGTGSSYSTNAVNSSWFITEAIAGGSNVDITLQWNATQELPGFSNLVSRFGHYTSGSWQLGTAGVAQGSNPYSFTGTAVTSFSPFGIFNDNAVVPLQFIDFAAQKCAGTQVCLNWQTASEQNVAHFIIERSTDGNRYKAVGQLSAKNRAANYYYGTDDIATLHQADYIYYRIKQVDQDGKFSYSNIQVVSSSLMNNITVYPNPVSDVLMISNANQLKRLQLSDLSGRNLRQKASNLSALYLRDLAPGIYILKMEMKNGTTVEQKIVKQ